MLLLDSLDLVPRPSKLDNPLRKGHHHCLATSCCSVKRSQKPSSRSPNR
ncbi:MAG: hypothetical protein Ct9H300mP1_01350 [Planctomycetaceae bacterium]|nr:MAG: hypothetical protein Ct9H300mP1_01350 [Planctomycetaceae bacterium]